MIIMQGYRNGWIEDKLFFPKNFAFYQKNVIIQEKYISVISRPFINGCRQHRTLLLSSDMLETLQIWAYSLGQEIFIPSQITGYKYYIILFLYACWNEWIILMLSWEKVKLVLR